LRTGNEEKGETVGIVEQTVSSTDDCLGVGCIGNANTRLDTAVIWIYIFAEAGLNVPANSIIHSEFRCNSKLVLRKQTEFAML